MDYFIKTIYAISTTCLLFTMLVLCVTQAQSSEYQGKQFKCETNQQDSTCDYELYKKLEIY